MRKTSHKTVTLALACALLLACVPAAAAPQDERIIVEWVPSSYTDEELNKETFVSVSTEYPVYKPGVRSINIVFTNHTDRMLSHGLGFSLERYKNGGWQTVQQIITENTKNHVYFPYIGLILLAKDTNSLATDPAKWDLALPEGRYRIIKDFGYSEAHKYHPPVFSAEFLVAEGGHDDQKLCGYAKLEALPQLYTKAQALADNVFYMDSEGRAWNADAMRSFLDKMQKQLPAMVRILQEDDAGSVILTDVTNTDGTFYMVERDESRVTGVATREKRYFHILTASERNGKTALRLVQTLDPSYTLADSFTLVENINLVGAYRAEAAVKGSDRWLGYRIYSPYISADGSQRFFGFQDGYEELYREEPYEWVGKDIFSHHLSLQEGNITDEQGLAKQLLGMKFVDEARVELTFSRKDSKRGTCVILFNLDTETVEQERYTE